MEKNYADFRVTLNEGLEVIWIRRSKIDATKRLTKEMLQKIGNVSSYSLSPS